MAEFFMLNVLKLRNISRYDMYICISVGKVELVPSHGLTAELFFDTIHTLRALDKVLEKRLNSHEHTWSTLFRYDYNLY